MSIRFEEVRDAFRADDFVVEYERSKQSRKEFKDKWFG
jgi:hypothetical protein